jgi:hypothetical protein
VLDMLAIDDHRPRRQVESVDGGGHLGAQARGRDDHRQRPVGESHEQVSGSRQRNRHGVQLAEDRAGAPVDGGDFVFGQLRAVRRGNIAREAFAVGADESADELRTRVHADLGEGGSPGVDAPSHGVHQCPVKVEEDRLGRRQVRQSRNAARAGD